MFFCYLLPNIYSISSDSSKLVFLNSGCKLELLGRFFKIPRPKSDQSIKTLLLGVFGGFKYATGLRPSDLSHIWSSHFLLPMTALGRSTWHGHPNGMSVYMGT